MVVCDKAITNIAPVPEKSGQAHLAFLDGLRGIAALWVVLSHIWICQFGMLAHVGLCGLLTNWVLYSHLAVDIFIVLSGFCLILPVARTGKLPNGAVAFYLRRAQRILPPFYAALAVSLVISLLLKVSNHQPAVLSLKAILVNAALLQDVFLSQNIFNGPFWSIAVEWRIYFLFPIVVWVLARFGCTFTLLWTAALGYALTGAIFQWHPDMLMACPWYLCLFAMGSCAGWIAFNTDVSRRVKEAAWGVAAVIFGLAMGGLIHRYPVTAASSARFGSHMPLVDAAAGASTACGLIALSLGLSGVGRHFRDFLGSRLMAGLGTFAYSLYLVHLPCLQMLNRLLSLMSLNSMVQEGLLALIGLPLVIGLAYLFFLVFERPFLRARPPIAPHLSH